MKIDFGSRVPFNLPTCDEFSEAISWIKSPLLAFKEAVFLMEDDSGPNPNKTITSIANMIFIFLEQLDYLMEHACIDGRSIEGAEIKHPFKIEPLDKNDCQREAEESAQPND